MSKSFTRWLPVCPVAGPAALSLLHLEDRVTPAYLFLDFGDNYPAGALDTTAGALRDVDDQPGTDNDIYGPSSITPNFSSEYAPATPVRILPAGFSPQDRAEIVSFNRRLFAPFNVTVVDLTATPQPLPDGRSVVGATGMPSVITTLRDAGGSKDAYMFVGDLLANPGTPQQAPPPPGLLGISPSGSFGGTADLFAYSNVHDDVAFSYTAGFTAQLTAGTISHEAGHQFGLQHSLTQIPNAPITEILHLSENMGYLSQDTNSQYFSNYPTISGDNNSNANPSPASYDKLAPGRGKFTYYDQFADDPNVGANKAFSFVTGTGANDRVTIARASATTAKVSVEAFFQSDYAPFSAIEVPGTQTNGSVYSYTIPLDRPILIYGGTGTDEITVDADLGVDIDIRGMVANLPRNGGQTFPLPVGLDTLIVNGKNAPTATFTADAKNLRNEDLVNATKGTLTIGSMNIAFETSGFAGQVRVRDVGLVTFVSPGGADDLTLGGAGGFARLSGTVNGGTKTHALGLENVGRLVVDARNGDAVVAADDRLTVDAGVTLPAGGVAFLAGSGFDSVAAAGDADFALSDALLSISKFGSVELDSVESAALTGGASSNVFDLAGWSGSAALDGKGAVDTFVGQNLPNKWTINAVDAGGVNGVITFKSIGNIVGGTESETFSFSGGGRLTGALVGGGGRNALNFSASDSAQRVTLVQLGDLNGFDGVVFGAGTSQFGGPLATIAGGFSDFDSIVGSAKVGDTFAGLSGNSTFTHTGSGGVYREDAAGRSLSYGDFESLDGGAGRDLFFVRGTAGNPVTFNGLGGDDSFRVGSNAGVNDDGSLDAVLADLALDGGAGTNALTVSDFAGAGNANAVVSATTITGLAPATITYRASGGDFATPGDGVVIRGSNSGADTITIQGTTAGASTRVEGLGGDDNLTVTGPGNVLAALAGQLVLVFGGGSDSVTVSDRGNAAPTVGTLDATTLTGLGLAAGLVYSDAPEAIGVETGSGADTFTIGSTSPGTAVRVDTGGGADRVSVRAIASATRVSTGEGDDEIRVSSDAGSGEIGTLAGINGELTLDAGGGFNNRLVISDFGGAAHPNAVIGTTFVTGLAPGAINFASTGGGYAASGGLVFRGSNLAADSFTVVGTLPNSGIRVEGLGGDDTFNVVGNDSNLDAIQGALFVDGGFGNNALSVSDLNAGIGNARAAITASQVAGMAGPSNAAAVNYANVRTLSVRGSEFADAITVTNPAALLSLDAGGGDDALSVEALGAGSPVTILAGGGDDRVAVGGGPGGLRAVLTTVNLDGGSGTNALALSDAGSSVGLAGVRVTGGQVTGLAGPGGVAPINYVAFATLGLRGSEAADGVTVLAPAAALSLDAGGGDDVVRVEALAPGLPATVTGGAGDDLVSVTNLDAVQAPLTVGGGGGADRLDVVDLGGAGRAYALSATNLNRLGFAGLTYADIDLMNLRGGDGSNRYDISGTGASASTVIDDGAGTSTFNIRGDALTGRSGFNGNGGDDTFALDASRGLTGASVAVAVVGGAGRDVLRVAARPGDDALTVRATAAAIGTLDGLGQTANFEDVDEVAIDGQGGSNSLAFVDDTGLTFGGATDPDAGLLVRPTGAASGDVRIGLTGPFPAVSFVNVNGAFSVSGDGDGSGDRDTVTVLAPSRDGRSSARGESTSRDGADAIAVSDTGVQITNAALGALRSVALADGNGRPSFANLIVRGGDEVGGPGDTFTVTPSSRVNILVDGGAGSDRLQVGGDGTRRTFTPTGDARFGPAQTRVAQAGGAGFGFVNIEGAPGSQLLVSGAAAPGGSQVIALDPATGESRFANLTPFPGYTGGLSVAAGDVTGDGVADIVVGAGLGGGPVVVVYDGLDGREIARFFAYEESARVGVQVAVGDVDGDGFGDIVTGTGAGGGPRVQVFSGRDFSQILNYFAYEESFRGGVTVAAGDTDGDGFADILTGTGTGGAPRVTVFGGQTLAIRADFFAFDPDGRSGVAVALGDVDGDGVADFVAATAAGTQTLIRAYSGVDAALLADFAVADSIPAGAPAGGGVRVATADVDGDAIADILLSNDSPGAPLVRGFKIATRADAGVTLGSEEVFRDALFAPNFGSGSSVAGSN